jgi:Right handed beta helix region
MPHLSPSRICLTAALTAASALAFSPSAFATNWCVNPKGSGGCQTTIGAAVAAAAPGDVIYVGRGTYKEGVIITKPLALKGDGEATTTIDATGLPNGIFINGIATAPKAGVSDVTITGFKVTGANFEGILAASASGVTISHNHVTKNNKSLSGGLCPGIPDWETSEQNDCGEGIHLAGVDHSILMDNVSDYNSGGILVTDETGPTYANFISQNVVRYNGEACGITLASHPIAAIANPSNGTASFGVYQNTVANNVSSYNGLNNGGGAGIGMYAPGPGQANYGNVAIGNTLVGNGLPGVAMHTHAPVPGAVILRDNSVINNTFRGNGADTGDAATAGPTGINISSVVPATGMVVTGNVMEDEAIGISFNSPASASGAPPQMQAHFNQFEPGTTGISVLGPATVDGTQNWWGCARGPAWANCASATGGVMVNPWLTRSPAQQQ